MAVGILGDGDLQEQRTGGDDRDQGQDGGQVQAEGVRISGNRMPKAVRSNSSTAFSPNRMSMA